MLGLPMTYFELRVFAAQITISQTQPPPFGKRWLGTFLVRNLEIKGYRARRIYLSYINRVITTIIRDWFTIFCLLAIVKIKLENRYNTDKGGIAEGNRLNNIVLGSSRRRVIIKRSNGSRI